MPVLPPQPSHPDPQGGDLLLGLRKGAEGGGGATRLPLRLEAAGDHIGEALAEICQPVVEPAAGYHLLVLAEGALHQQVDLFRRVVAEQVERHVVGGGELTFHCHLFAGSRLVDRADVDVGLLEDHAVADGIDPPASCPAHQLRQLARGQRREVAAVEFRKR